MDENARLLDEEIKEEIEALSHLEFGNEEHTKAIDNLAKLYKLRIEETRNRLEHQEKAEACERDEQIRRDQLAEQVKDRYFRLGIAAAELVLPLMFYAGWMKKGFRFEETGTFTSATFKGLINRFRPTKK